MTESVASLLSRLGTPPSDLIDHLTERFQAICEAQSKTGHGPIKQVDPHHWLVTSDGDLLFKAPDVEQPSINTEESPPQSSAELAAEFRRLLATPPVEIKVKRPLETNERQRHTAEHTAQVGGATVASSRIAGQRTAGQRTAGQRATNYNSNPDLGVDQNEYSDADRKRREQIAEMLTTSLTNRFGEDVISAEPEPESQPPKYELIQRDRRFNWNLVMGVATVAAVAAIGYAGYRVSENRKQRMASGISSLNYESPTPTKESTAPNVDIAEPPATDDSKITPLKDSSASAFNQTNTDRQVADPLETLETLMDDGEPVESGQVSIEMENDPLAPVDIEVLPQLPRTQPNQNAAAKAANETLVKALEPPEQPSNIPEAPQKIRPAQSRYVRLPSSTKPGTTAEIAVAGTNVIDVEFPVKFPIGFAKQPNGAQLVNTQSDAVLAKLSSANERVVFEWDEAAIRDSTAKRLLHGRLKPDSGQPIYLRPSIETDPFQLTLRVRDTHPTWNLGAPILPKVTRLDVELDVPNLLEYGWSEPFDATRPSRGSAVAILTPPDGESVALAVQVNVRCDRQLSCNLKYAARLDQSKPWLPITREGMLRAEQGVKRELAVLENKKDNFSRMYAASDSAARRMMRRNGEEIDQSLDITKTTMERMTILKTLVNAIESSVTLNLHLYVQWEDDQQTILRTSTVSPDAL